MCKSFKFNFIFTRIKFYNSSLVTLVRTIFKNNIIQSIITAKAETFDFIPLFPGQNTIAMFNAGDTIFK